MSAAAHTPGRFKNTEKGAGGSAYLPEARNSTERSAGAAFVCRKHETARKKVPVQRLSAGSTKQKRGTYAGK